MKKSDILFAYVIFFVGYTFFVVHVGEVSKSAEGYRT